MRQPGMISDELIQSMDISNTLHGGVSQPEVRISQYADYRLIELKVPGLSEEQMHVKINNNQLLVFYELLIESRGNVIAVPFIAYNKQIPYFIDAKKISARFIDNVLTVQLPYNELAKGYHRDIPIGNH